MPSGSGTLISLEQTVARIGSGTLITLQQEVQAKVSGSGSLITLVQAVKNSGSGRLISLEQTVKSVAEPVKRFDVILTIGGKEIEHKYLTGDASTTRREGDASLMNVVLDPDAGLQDLSFYHGKDITLDVIKDNKVTRVYTGTVDIPEVNIINELITLRCSNVRKELDNALPASLVEGIGFYTSALFSESEDQAEELSKRLETVEACLDYDAYLIPHYTEWAPKASADFVIDDADIYLRTPKYVVAGRGRIVNRVDVDLEYQYQRLRHRERNFEFDSGLSACEYDAWGLPPTVQMLRSAIEGAGWAFTELNTVGLDPGGAYGCYGSTVYYSPKSGTTEIQVKKDSDGNVVTDSNGNPQYESVSRQSVDSTNLYATSATWKAATRFSQNVSEKITLSIQAPQSIGQYGEVSANESFGVRSEFDDEDFSNFDSYTPPPEHFTVSSNGDYIYDADNENGAKAEFSKLVYAAIYKAIAKIRGSHRDNYVIIQVPLWPEIDLRHTIESTAGRIKFKGKVRQVSHHFNFGKKRTAYTELEIALSQANGSQAAGSISVSRPTVDDATGHVTDIKYGTHTIPLNGEQDPLWTGYILKQLANISSLAPIGFKTPVAMIVDTPDIDDASREDKEVTKSQTENINIRNDLLEIMFNG
jgi:hypothetical protein